MYGIDKLARTLVYSRVQRATTDQGGRGRELDSLIAMAEFNLLLHHLVLYFQQLLHLRVAILLAQHGGRSARVSGASLDGER